MKRVAEVLGWLTAVAILAFAGHAVFAAAPAGRQQQQGESESRSRTRTARERREDLSPASIMRDARTLYVAPSEHVEKKYLEYKLHKHPELDDWGLMLVAEPSAADLVLTVDKTALNYIFTITDRRTSVIVTSGKCVAVNGRLAAEYLGKEIVKKIRDVRAASDGRHKRRHTRDDDYDEDEESES
ncbi:MAG TPA: hypothetical protein VM936_21485 [Pyrinomonadaceae bacterium]|nr:hypothetical protein [Pyrinomonadaceae bacterium]